MGRLSTRRPTIGDATPGVREQALAHLRLLFADREGLVELRMRNTRTGRWSQRFWPAEDIDDVVACATGSADCLDVYVGVLPRVRRSGRRRDLPDVARMVWVDLDRPDATAVLYAASVPSPTLVVGSGSPGHLHLYWRLAVPVELRWLESLNAALAVCLGGDRHAGDAPRILRLAGTLNHKPPHPTPVRLDRQVSDAERTVRFEDLRALAGAASATGPVEARITVESRNGETRRPSASAKVRELERVPPVVYVEALTGWRVPSRSRKVACPLHEDDTPSLHVYQTAEQGWFCFGCRRGGSVYDLAAAMLDRPLRGPGFIDLQRDLVDLLVDRSVPQGRRS
ncbi:MAG: CHC2 zinc finger domain-containing protein [Solirubrobacteraceae bacterium]